MSVGLIWAQSDGGVIGRGDVMPWRLPEDLAYFKRVTDGGAVIMGRKTWDSLPARFRPLVGRTNIVVTRTAGWSAYGAFTAASVDEALALAGDRPVWVIGGGQIYALLIGQADTIHVTEIRAEFHGDTFAPAIGPEWAAAAVDPTSGWRPSKDGLEHRFVRYVRA